MGAAPLGRGELKERRGSHIWGSPLIDRDMNWDRREFMGYWKRVPTAKQDRVKPTQMVCATALHALA